MPTTPSLSFASLQRPGEVVPKGEETQDEVAKRQCGAWWL